MHSISVMTAVVRHVVDMCAAYSFRPVVPKVGGTAPWGAVGLPRWALIGMRGGRGR
jgi:hypothetical protein